MRTIFPRISALEASLQSWIITILFCLPDTGLYWVYINLLVADEYVLLAEAIDICYQDLLSICKLLAEQRYQRPEVHILLEQIQKDLFKVLGWHPVVIVLDPALWFEIAISIQMSHPCCPWSQYFGLSNAQSASNWYSECVTSYTSFVILNVQIPLVSGRAKVPCWLIWLRHKHTITRSMQYCYIVQLGMLIWKQDNSRIVHCQGVHLHFSFCSAGILQLSRFCNNTGRDAEIAWPLKSTQPASIPIVRKCI